MEITILKIKNVLESLIGWVVANENDGTIADQDKWLYGVFDGNTNGNYDYLEQIKELIVRDEEDPNKLEVKLMYDSSRADLPTIHIHLPSERKGSANAIGKGFEQTEELDANNNVISCNAQSYTATYDLIITGSGTDEIILIYEFIKAIFTAGAATLDYHFELFDYAGNELMTNERIVPYLTFYRAITLTVQNRITVRSVTSVGTIGDLDFEGTAIDG